MGRGENVTSAPPPGAGRVRDLNWPDHTTAGTALNGLLNLRCRITGAATGGVLNTFTTITGGWNFFQGMDVVQLVGGAAGGQGGSISWQNNTNIQIRTSNVANWPLDDDWNVHRIVWISCINGAVATDNDMGLELLSTNVGANGILKTPCPGLGFRYATGGKFNFISRTFAGGLTERTLATDGVGGYHVTDFHSVDLRLFSALPNQPAFAKVLLDDQLVLTLPWATSNLPVNGEGASTFPGFFPTILCNASNAAGMFTRLISFQAGPTESACL